MAIKVSQTSRDPTKTRAFYLCHSIEIGDLYTEVAYEYDEVSAAQAYTIHDYRQVVRSPTQIMAQVRAKGFRYCSDLAIQFTEVDARSQLAVIDMCCGTGNIGRILYQAGFRSIDGLDASAQMLARAQNKGCYRLGVVHNICQTDGGGGVEHI